ncbi:MAG: NHLP bacteriocin export ABC transporter permease/ATPase subunit, partial [Chromatiales bacterium]|nr:NHLP bacteriocin export ABC transporter permease/ATPase subunit [Chromatiales bacterium]
RRAEELFEVAGIAFYSAIENWVYKLSEFAAGDLASTVVDRFPHHGKFGLPDGMRIGAERDHVSWIQVEDGAVCPLGIDELRVGKLPFPMPIGGELWVEARGEVRMFVRSTDHRVEKLQLLRGLALFNSLLQRRLRMLEATEQAAEAARLQHTEQRERRVLRAALEEMSSALNPRPQVTVSDDPLLGAANAVGEALGATIRPPARSENMRLVADPIEPIARASRLRHRRVLLAGEWWRSDCGPLIGFMEADGRPVALLRTEGRGYDVLDPADGTRTAVTAETALDLAPQAIMLYRALPDDVVRPWHLTRFSLRGRGLDVLLVIALSVATTLIGMITPQAIALIMDKAIPDANERLMLELGLGLVAAAFGVGLFGLAQGVISIRLGIGADALTQPAVWDRLLKLRVNFFKRYSGGDLLSRAMAVSEVNHEMNGQTLKSLLSSLVSSLNLGLLYYYNSRLAIMALGLGLAVAVVTIIGGSLIRKYYRALMELRGNFFGLVVQLVNGVSKIRVAGAQRRAFALWADRYAEQVKLMLRAQMLEDYVVVFNQAIPIVSSILLFWIGVSLLGAGPTEPSSGAAMAAPALTVGVFLAFNSAMGTFLSGATTLSGTVLEVMDTLVKARRMEPLLEAELEVDDAKIDPGVLRGEVALTGVDFRYQEDGPKILDDVSVVARPGEFVAFVGPSGSGKSTIFRLLLGFEVPEVGQVRFDGKDLLGLDVAAVRRQLGVVMQSGRINAGSIFDNIVIGAPLSMDECWQAVEDAGFADDVRQMPMGLHTMVSEGGTNLSGGQRQRLLIARALVTNPRILLLDEATSALDNRTQTVVSRALDRRRVTRIVVAHRLSTIRNADRIYVLSKGRVVEAGTYEELVRGPGVFASMMARQVA